ncbi:hypothetical protein PAPYR_2632 [Paratrimastix pyriformis]|uniref:TLC domain-containing protein n=1 Tax=Paratrimastix pyriformis TaxID=342808 RepID=A0ABQ8UPS5_9EUKA|nr:hypothetical protein PAPYR_2632 [Paratrimastix pyriformis]|eukprot:GAFH01000158.1.p1 GENE.GAFH01000158.1~~GAFH01000158.1.p1  ORF type:complete len:271 (-),score=78.56 GAFH01000158.1:160-972(-)
MQALLSFLQSFQWPRWVDVAVDEYPILVWLVCTVAVFVVNRLVIAPLDYIIFGKTYRKLNKIARFDWDIRVLSNTQAAYQLICASILAYVHFDQFYNNTLFWSSTGGNLFLLVAQGYFFEDLIIMLAYRKTQLYSAPAVWHHIITLFTCLSSVILKRLSTGIICVGFFEVSTFLLNQIWFQETRKVTDWRATLTGVLTFFALTYRAIACGGLLWLVGRHFDDLVARYTLLEKFLSAMALGSFTLLNVAWFAMGVVKMIQTFMPKKAQKSA